jgi:amino acid transporter, AAT family
LSRAGYAPRRFGALSARGTRVAALLLSSAGIAVGAALNVLYRDASFTLMMAVSMFGGMFTWLMIFITHLLFRRRRADAAAGFHMWGYPYTSLLGSGLMIAALITTVFTREFRMTLFYGVPFLLALTALFFVRYRRGRSDIRNAREAIRI